MKSILKRSFCDADLKQQSSMDRYDEQIATQPSSRETETANAVWNSVCNKSKENCISNQSEDNVNIPDRFTKDGRKKEDSFPTKVSINILVFLFPALAFSFLAEVLMGVVAFTFCSCFSC